MAEPAACPYCQSTIPRIPKRRTRCPSCGQMICVREGRICTEEGARAADWIRRLQIPSEAVAEAEKHLTKEFSRPPSPSDVVWRLMNAAASKTTNVQQLRLLYWQMAEFLWEEGRDHVHTAREAVRMGMAGWEQAADQGLIDWSRTRLVVITAREHSCEACRMLEGVTFTYHEACTQMPLPVANCTHGVSRSGQPGWCRCVYGLVFNRG